MKKLALVLVLVFALAIPALANPFVDVPLNHWAYDAVQTLAAKGVIIGYPDGTFGGQRTMTRYEFAEALARVLAYVEQYGGLAEDVEILSKLAVEFADELAALGVTVADLEATIGEHSEAVAAMKELVDKHEKFFEPVKITGKSNVHYSVPVLPTVGTGVLKDSTDLTFTVEINDTTTLGVDFEIENILSKNAAFDLGGGDFWLKHYGEDLSLWIGDIAPATIGLGLIYDAGRVDNVFSCDDLSYYGVWAQWNWNDDEDCEDDENLGTWTAILKPDDFYMLNIAFNLGDDDDIPVGVTAGWDRKAGGVVAGADLAFDLTDEDDDEQVGLALEGGVFSDLAATTAFGAVAKLDATFGDEDDIDAYVKGWFVQPGFVPTLGYSYNADELGVEVGVTFALTDEDDEDIQVAINPYWHYEMDSAMAAAKEHYVGAELDFTNIDEDHPETEAYILAEYYLVPAGEIYFEGQILNVILGDDDDEELANFVFNAYGDYTLAAVPDYTAVANFIYSFEDEPMTLTVEGRLDSDGAAPYSAEAKLKYTLDTNTSVYLGAEMNNWKADINEWDSLWCEGVIDDSVTKVYAGVDVSF